MKPPQRPDPSTTPERGGRAARGLRRLALLLAFAALVAGAARCWPRTVDDAFITFRYAENLAEGRGACFNPGERVEGYSSPSWMLLSAGVVALGGEPVAAAKWLGLGCSALLVLLVWAEARRIDPEGWAAAVGALLLGTSFVLQIWSVAGMETNAYALLLFAGLAALAREAPSPRAALLASTLLVGAALTRPEGLAFWLAGTLLVAVGVAPPRWRTVAAYLAPGTALAGHLAWRLAYYGETWPNTYHAKTGGGTEMWLQGLDGLRRFAADPAHAVWLAGALAGAALALADGGRRRRPAAVFSAAALAHLLYVVSVGDDGLRVHRFYVPALAPLAVLLALATASPAGRRGRGALRGLAALAAAITVAASLWALHARFVPALLGPAGQAYQEGNEKLGRHLRASRPAGTRIAVAAAGAVPYFSGLETIDMYGLNDRHIARVPFPERARGRLMKWDNAHVLSRDPDLVVINRGYFRAGDLDAPRVARDPGLLAADAMDRDLFTRVARDGRFGLRALDLGDGSVFWVFERFPAGDGEAGR